MGFKDGMVSFCWKDYRDQGRKKIMTLPASEFIRRFLMHIVPAGFVRIRHYGFLANRNRGHSLCQIRTILSLESSVPTSDITARNGSQTVSTDDALHRCPVCKRGNMVPVAVLFPVLPVDSS